MFDVGRGERRRMGKDKGGRGRALVVQAEVNELPARPFRLPAGTPGAPGRELVL